MKKASPKKVLDLALVANFNLLKMSYSVRLFASVHEPPIGQKAFNKLVAR